MFSPFKIYRNYKMMQWQIEAEKVRNKIWRERCEALEDKIIKQEVDREQVSE